ncbi:MAG: KilA-N domain-containing protein [Lutibacter sp.]|jgi:hypothetical protein
MKAIEFIYQENAIHFLVNPKNDNVMINATEMAKAFNKRVEDFKRLDGTSIFIEALLKSENSKFEHADVREQLTEKDSENSKFEPSHVREQLTEKDVIYGTNKATFMHRKLAMYFAFWLDVDFQIWIIDTIDDILFGNYKQHDQAVIENLKFEKELEDVEVELYNNPLFVKYQNINLLIKTTNAEKRKALKAQINQIKLDFSNSDKSTSQ